MIVLLLAIWFTIVFVALGVYVIDDGKPMRRFPDRPDGIRPEPATPRATVLCADKPTVTIHISTAELPIFQGSPPESNP